MMRRVMTASVVAWAAGFAGALACPACGGSSAAQPPARPLPAYEGHAAELFDDAIEPTAVGYPAEPGASPLRDNRLRERTQVADAVVRARVTTVTTKAEDRGHTYQLGFHTIDHLAGSGPLDPDFTVRVDASDPAAGIVGAYESRLIGSTFIVFVREFTHPGAPADSDLRFHVARDQKDELDAVHAAVQLGP